MYLFMFKNKDEMWFPSFKYNPVPVDKNRNFAQEIRFRFLKTSFRLSLSVFYILYAFLTCCYSNDDRGRPEWGFKKPEPEPDFLSKISVLINRNRICSFPIRFLIDRNRNSKKWFRFLINRNRNSSKLPEFRFLIRFRSSTTA